MNKFTSLLVVVAAGLMLSACTLFQSTTPVGTSEESMENSETEMMEQENNEAMGQESSDSGMMEDDKMVALTAAEVAKHDNAKDCWFTINGKVYDVTPFIATGLHPGGEAILEGCGKDATELFMTRPMGSGTPHSAAAQGRLETYYLGELITL